MATLQRMSGFLLLVHVGVLLACQPPSDPGGDLPLNQEWGNETPITITGYTGNAMEPKVTADGSVLFFNNKTADDTQMDIHYATRVSDTQYQYAGVLPGANAANFLDGVPAVDASLGFYFVSTRSYASDFITLYGGQFDGSQVNNVAPIGAQLTTGTAGDLNMDVDVTPDGQFLVFSRAHFSGAPVPDRSDLDLAARSGQTFVDVDAAALFGEVNTPDYLEYAGTISADGLELYFTRAVDIAAEDGLRVLVSKRASASASFGPPARIAAIDGISTEAPALSGDGSALYFHRRDGGTFKIFRVTR